jgi:hypothetical protein
MIDILWILIISSFIMIYLIQTSEDFSNFINNCLTRSPVGSTTPDPKYSEWKSNEERMKNLYLPRESPPPVDTSEGSELHEYAGLGNLHTGIYTDAGKYCTENPSDEGCPNFWLGGAGAQLNIEPPVPQKSFDGMNIPVKPNITETKNFEDIDDNQPAIFVQKEISSPIHNGYDNNI